MAQRYRSTPRGTFPTSSPLTSQTPLGYSEILRTLGPYSAGPMAERAARDAVAERDAAMASGRGATLRDAILGQTLNSPTGANRMRAAAMGASPMELAKLMPQRSGMDPQTEAGMSNITSAARGVRGATSGRVAGSDGKWKNVLAPAAGKKNRDAFQSDVGDLGLDGSNMVSRDAVTWKQYQQAANAQAAKRGEEERAQRRALDLKKQEGDNAARVAGITAKGTVDAASAKGSSGQLKDSEATRKQLGAARAQFIKEFDDKVGFTRRDTDIWASHNNRKPGSPEYEAEYNRRLVNNGLTNRDEYVARRARDTFSGALGTTQGYEYRQEVANEIFPGLFSSKPRWDLARAGLTPPSQLVPGAVPQTPMRSNGGPPPAPTPSPAPSPSPMGAVGSVAPAPSPAPQPPMPTAADLHALGRVLNQQAQQEAVDNSLEVGIGAQRDAMAGMESQQMASSLEAATSPQAFAQYGAGHPVSDDEIRTRPAEWLEAVAIPGMTRDLAKLPPDSMQALAMQQGIERAMQRVAQLRRTALPQAGPQPSLL